MRFAEFLVQEAFTSPYPFTWARKADKHWGGSFKTKDGDSVHVHIADDHDPKTPGFEIIFATNDSIDITAKGDGFRIFATVIAMVKEFIDAVKPNRLTFSAFKDEESDSNKSRAKLYAGLCQRFAEKNGYTFKRVMHDGYDDFELTRKPD